MESPLHRLRPLGPAEPGWVPVSRIAFGGPNGFTWRPKAPSGAQLGGPKRSKTPTWRSKAGLRAQLGGPRAFRRLSNGFPRAFQTIPDAEKPCSRAGESLIFIFLQHWLSTWLFGSTWSVLGASWAVLGASWAPLGLNLDALGANLGQLERPRGQLGRS